ncbi:hypothetical protein [Demequina sp.]|uniref:hypothetical protein n=1 Tax=Demequina sp. TaxID=2050685 RepID=UPI0025BE71EB|nr:hypothetical protein [Demequina sp.]
MVRTSTDGTSIRPATTGHSWAVAALLSTLLLAGCSASASDLEPPDIVWPDGMPSGPLEDSQWGQAYRNAEIQLSTAQAFGDFSDPDLIAAVGYDYADRAAWASSIAEFDIDTASQESIDSYTAFASKGVIIDILEQPDGQSAEVLVCGGWNSSATGVRTLLYVWTLTRKANGSITADYQIGDVDHYEDDPGGPRCRHEVSQPGLWVEPFDPEDIDLTDIKAPLPRDYYVDLGVISE